MRQYFVQNRRPYLEPEAGAELEGKEEMEGKVEEQGMRRNSTGIY